MVVILEVPLRLSVVTGRLSDHLITSAYQELYCYHQFILILVRGV